MDAETPTAEITVSLTGSGTAEIGDILDRVISRVPGFMSKPELQLLHQLATQSPATIVELGAFAGLSTTVLCLGAHIASVDVVTVDSFISWTDEWDTSEETLRETLAIMGFSPDNIEAMCRVSEHTLRENLAGFGFSPRIINRLTWEAADLVDGPIGLLFHDADHAGESIDKDLAAWNLKLARDGAVAFHDYANERWPEVTPAVDRWATREGWYKAERESRLQVFRRAGHGAVTQGLP